MIRSGGSGAVEGGAIQVLNAPGKLLGALVSPVKSLGEPGIRRSCQAAVWAGLAALPHGWPLLRLAGWRECVHRSPMAAEGSADLRPSQSLPAANDVCDEVAEE